jgi:hypothetical protein
LDDDGISGITGNSLATCRLKPVSVSQPTGSQLHADVSQCPNGSLVAWGNAFVNYGQDVNEFGNYLGGMGFISLGAEAVAPFVGVPEATPPLAVAGVALASAGTTYKGVGLIIQLTGASMLSIAGNSMPLQTATVRVGTTALNKAAGTSPGMPNPFTPLTNDALGTGTNPCPN